MAASWVIRWVCEDIEPALRCAGWAAALSTGIMKLAVFLHDIHWHTYCTYLHSRSSRGGHCEFFSPHLCVGVFIFFVRSRPPPACFVCPPSAAVRPANFVSHNSLAHSGLLRGRAWHLVTSTLLLCGGRGTCWHRRYFCVAGVAFTLLLCGRRGTLWLEWQLFHTNFVALNSLFHTQHCDRQLLHTHTALSHNSFTDNFVTHTHTTLFSHTHNIVTHNSFTHNSFTHSTFAHTHNIV